MQPVTPKCSFHPITNLTNQTQTHILELQCQRVLANRENVQLEVEEKENMYMPMVVRLLVGFYNCLLQKTNKNKESNAAAGCITFKISLFKSMLSAIQKKLFLHPTLQKPYEQTTYSLALKPNLIPYTISLLSQNTNLIPIQRLTSLYKTLTSDQYLLYLPIHLYFLYGGSLFTIQGKTFREKFVGLVEAMTKVLATSETVVTRNIQMYKNHKERKMILEESVKVVMLAKNKETLNQIANKITNNIFAGRQYLSKEQFLSQLQSKPIDPILAIFLLLLRAQFILFEEKPFHTTINSRNNTTFADSNFYSHEMTKLFNKCPFNGDQRCSCKKCQCVRRNRQSAKLNQEKKRNAVEQVDSMKKRIEELEDREKMRESKIAQLQEQNMMLKTLLKEIRGNPAMKSAMMQAIEPLSKVLNNQL